MINMRAFFLQAAALVGAITALSDASGIPANTRVTSYRDVAQIFDQQCTWCHSWSLGGGSGFVQQTYNSIMDGAYRDGKHERMVQPGNPDASVLVMYLDGRRQPQMPYNGKLTEPDLRKIRQWIADGARLDASTPVEHEIVLSHIAVPHGTASLYLSCRAPHDPVNVALRAKLVDDASGRVLSYTWPADRGGAQGGDYGVQYDRPQWRTWPLDTSAATGSVTVHLYVSNYWRVGRPAPNDATLDGTLFFLSFKEDYSSEQILAAREREFRAKATPSQPPVSKVGFFYTVNDSSDVTFRIFREHGEAMLYKSVFHKMLGAEQANWDIHSAHDVGPGWYVARIDFVERSNAVGAAILFSLK
jgi:hypothetical protein